MAAEAPDLAGLVEALASGNLRARRRLLLGEAAVVSPSQAVALLPMQAAKGRAFLRDRDLVRTVAGVRLVLWREVLAALADDEARPSTPSPTSTRRSRPRLVL